MNCMEAREMLADRALGTLRDDDPAFALERHLTSCAGCRREADEMAEGAAVLAVSIGGPVPPKDLEDRIVRTVAARPRGRRRRSVVAATIAAALGVALAVGSIAWAISVTRRSEVVQQRLAVAGEEAEAAATRLEQLILELSGAGLLSARLEPARKGNAASGGVIVYDAVRSPDLAIVIVGGLPARLAPYRVVLLDDGVEMPLGKLARTGVATYSLERSSGSRLGASDAVRVLDARAKTVLRGELRTVG